MNHIAACTSVPTASYVVVRLCLTSCGGFMCRSDRIVVGAEKGMYVFVYLFICYLFICLFCLFICLFVSLFVFIY